MGGDCFESLTLGQKACLRLTAQGYSSKDIARTLDVHPRTVDQRLDRAREKLGEQDRKAAARAFVRYEASEQMYDSVIYDPQPIAQLPIVPDNGVAMEESGSSPAASVVREAPASAPWDYDSQIEDALAKRSSYDAISPLYRLAIMTAILLVLVLAIVATPALHDSFQRVANSIDPPH